jgi:hypothetical protein
MLRINSGPIINRIYGKNPVDVTSNALESPGGGAAAIKNAALSAASSERFIAYSPNKIPQNALATFKTESI